MRQVTGLQEIAGAIDLLFPPTSRIASVAAVLLAG
jgi:uncharacterized membrane protein